MNEVPDSLLAADEQALVTVHNENGRSPFLIVADHADNSIPGARSARRSGNRMRAPHRAGLPRHD
jgi:hypothetical protein